MMESSNRRSSSMGKMGFSGGTPPGNPPPFFITGLFEIGVYNF